ncbi:TolC family protein [Pelagicoccus mobilis]|uniref:TolC family protein n=1 Tax=Pelagicoccus mobilis TaxID=415221 RepID=A0A934VST7_9BACT|nr:TolC family protein [Pelagicoccus mobilis]MBK1878839.1 TolC family protein [Pelagicoccus mobilis]
MNRTPLLSLTLTALAISGCVSTEDWQEKETLATPEQFTKASVPQLEIKDSLMELFDHQGLNSLVESALENNPELQRSRARLDEVAYSVTRAKSSQLPQLNANAAARRNDPVGGSPDNTYSIGLDASWEVDIWGKIRSDVRASKADLAAAEADYLNAEQSLVGQTMQAWFSLVSAEKILDLDARRVESFQSTENLVSRRFELGEATSTALNLAKTDLENAKADLQASLNNRDQAARTLNQILGSYPDAEYNHETQWPSLDTTVSAGLPSDLLTARPDVVAAYERLIAADERIKVSQSELFPSFRLTADGGRASSVLDDLSSSAFNSWSALAALSVNIFDAGARRSNIGAANSRAEQAYFNYQSVVLNALKEVENALGSEYYLASEETARVSALEAARRSMERAQRDYETGLVTILSLLESQRRVFNTERRVINLKASRLNNRVRLALSVGKGV